MKYKIGFLGGGKMCQAILGGILKSKLYSSEQIVVSEVDPKTIQYLE